MLDPGQCYDVMLRRDRSYDGRFFIGVRTTGIYCRPVCSARIPKRENVRFYLSAAAAEHAGHRPCLRCRPETAPFCPAWNGTRTTIERGLRLIAQGALDGKGSVAILSNRLGVGPRHLARLFSKHLDASPLAVAATLRLHRAKRLLSETDLPIAEIANQAGYTSPRRMNAAFIAVYNQSPTSQRRAPNANRTPDPLSVWLSMTPLEFSNEPGAVVQ
jgi:AraC family transcriptional regulator, regulatory protein of adaptative response / methylated-DNA-[protein]-cysteine methyltransferase